MSQSCTIAVPDIEDTTGSAYIQSMLFLHILVTCGTIIFMELAVTAIHKYIMHGFGWGWHKTHHEPHDHLFELNDLYAVIFAGLTVALFLVGDQTKWSWWIALGVTLYGLLYGLVHDVLVHRRLPVKWQPKHPYLQRLINAHHMHHVVREREGAVSFGFLYAPRLDALRRQLKRRKHDA